MKRIDLAFDAKNSKIGGSLKHNASSIHKEACAKADLPNSVHSVAKLDLMTVEMNIVKMIKQATKSDPCWHNLVQSGLQGLNNLLDLEYNACKDIMTNLNLFKTVNGLAFPKKTYYNND